MKRMSVNPSQWGLAYLMDQGEVVEGATRLLRCSGQVDLQEDADAPLGVTVSAPGDMRRQIGIALGNVDTILRDAGMGRRNLVFLRFFTTDVDAFLEHYDVYAEWIRPAGIRPPQSLLGIRQLALPDLMVEIEAEAAA
ncbi:RidA family protein [Leisingera sp. D0M16]|uniref:RidA family protein n=1 Tax=Leisingera coralii TaxID=3351347 RepID=UPI003B8187A6